MACLLLHAASGGLYFFIQNKPADVRDIESYFVGLSESWFINNSAKLTGGAIFTNSLNALGVCFNCSTLRIESTPSPEEPLKRVTDIKKNSTKGVLDSIDLCDLFWTGNMADEKEGGENVGTTASTVKICKVRSQKCINQNGLLMLLNHTSGKFLEEINITLFDYQNKPALGQPKMRLEITANSKDVSLTGQLSSDFKHNTSLTDVRVQGPVSSWHNLTVLFHPNILSNIDFKVEIRGCMAGEIEDEDHRGCTFCGRDLYSFNPNQICTPCPENAVCTPSTITPENGFWHSTSRSAQVHKCIVEDACNWSNRAHELGGAAMEAHKKESVLCYHNTSYKQCADVSIQLIRKYCGT